MANKGVNYSLQRTDVAGAAELPLVTARKSLLKALTVLRWKVTVVPVMEYTKVAQW